MSDTERIRARITEIDFPGIYQGEYGNIVACAVDDERIQFRTTLPTHMLRAPHRDVFVFTVERGCVRSVEVEGAKCEPIIGARFTPDVWAP